MGGVGDMDSKQRKNNKTKEYVCKHMCKLWANFQNKEEKSCDNSDTKIARKHTRSQAEGFIPDIPSSLWESQTY